MASLETIITLTGENLTEDSAVWVDGRQAPIVSAADGRLRFTVPFTEIPLPRTVAVSVVSGKQTSNAHSLRLVPPGTLDPDERIGLLGYPQGSVLIDDTPGKERLIILDRRAGLFEFDRENRRAKPYLPTPGPGEATAITRRASDGTLYLATRVGDRVVELFEIDATKKVRQILIQESPRAISHLAAYEGGLYVAFEGSCRIDWAPADLRRSFQSLLTLSTCDSIGGLATNAGALYVSIERGVESRVEERAHVSPDIVEETWTLEAPGVLAAGDDYLVARTANRLAELRPGTVKRSGTSIDLAVNSIHIVDDGLLMTARSEESALWTEPVDDSDPMATEVLFRPPFAQRAHQGNEGHYLDDENYSHHVTKEGELTFIPSIVVGTDRQGRPLFIDPGSTKVERLDPREGVTSTVVDLAEQGWHWADRFLHVGDWFIFAVETLGSTPGIGRMRTDGSEIELIELADRSGWFLAAGSDNRIYIDGASFDGQRHDGIWSFDPLASFEASEFPDLRFEFPFNWGGVPAGAFADRKGRLVVTDSGITSRLVEVDLQKGLARPLLEGGMVALEEDASGRLLVLEVDADAFISFDPDAMHFRLSYLYR